MKHHLPGPRQFEVQLRLGDALPGCRQSAYRRGYPDTMTQNEHCKTLSGSLLRALRIEPLQQIKVNILS